MGRRQRDSREIDGILLLDKPAGLSSNAALQRVKHRYRAARAGHTGSLDPLATGLLPICLGRATRLADTLLDAEKRYRATVRLGTRTDTGDAEGRAVAHSDPRAMPPDALGRMLPGFVGPIRQVPPMYSALKRAGRPLYVLARQGLEVARPARPVTVHELRLLDLQADRFEFEVRCSKGTYVRTLAEDWAAAVGQCAHLIALRRIGLGCYGAADMHTLEAVEAATAAQADGWLRPLAELLAGYPALRVDDGRARRLAQGQALTVEEAPRSGELAVFDEEGRPLCMAYVDAAGRIAPRRWLGAAGQS